MGAFWPAGDWQGELGEGEREWCRLQDREELLAGTTKQDATRALGSGRGCEWRPQSKAVRALGSRRLKDRPASEELT